MVNDSEESTSVKYNKIGDINLLHQEDDTGHYHLNKLNKLDHKFSPQDEKARKPTSTLYHQEQSIDLSSKLAAFEKVILLFSDCDHIPISTPKKTDHNQQESIVLSNARPHKCTKCQATFKHELSLQDHKCSPQDENQQFQCPTCNLTFNTLNRLNIHQRKHNKDRPHECSVCPKKFKVFGTLRRHEQKIHAKHRTSCPICDKFIADSQSLNRHVRSHKNLTTYECDRCEAVFKKKCNLNDHQRTHTGESRFSCKVCTKPFKTSRSLRFHLNTHTGKLPYQCQKCQEAFRNPVSLKYHEYIHTGETPYPCDVCDKSFRTPTHRRNHKRNCRRKMERTMVTMVTKKDERR